MEDVSRIESWSLIAGLSDIIRHGERVTVRYVLPGKPRSAKSDVVKQGLRDVLCSRVLCPKDGPFHIICHLSKDGMEFKLLTCC